MNKKLMARLKAQGEKYYLDGKPIGAYYDMKLPKGFVLWERGRAVYEMGWRNAKHDALRHENRVQDSVYAKGFESDTDTNPYKYPQELSDQRLALSVQETLTADDRKNLFRMNQEFGSTEWDRWGRGKTAQRRQALKSSSSRG